MQKNDPYAALRYPEFRLFLLVRFALVFAWSMQFVVIEWEVYRMTKDPLSLGIIGLMEVVPAISLALFAGHLVDQKEKRNLLILCTLAFFALSVALFFITNPIYANDSSTLYSIYGLVFFGGIVRTFINPTLFSLMALIVPKELYPNAASWSSSSWQMSAVLGPAMAGFTIFSLGTHTSMLLILGCIVLAFVFLIQIKSKAILNPKIGEPIFQSLREGVKFVYQTKIILGAITLDMIAVLFGGAIALLPIFATDILGVGSEGFGILRAAPAVGSFVIMFAVAYFPINKHAGLKLLFSIFGFGVCMIVFGLSTSFWLSVFALFMSGITDGVSMVIRQTILQLYTPDNMRGRVSSVNSMFVGSSNELGAFESGFTAKLMGTVTAVVFGGSMTLITVVLTGLFSKQMRTLDFQEELNQEVKEETEHGEHLVP
ncbi:MAG: MFS permease [uncultured Aureispira sp.]|uniref:MFS permease n=1 Tax=uncultured Aureispira sp. TaxID=1331704 RepID=A0A6S6UGE2_9BACT|nr:MAG: MFS permease [uncultured Aureispira sp.]